MPLAGPTMIRRQLGRRLRALRHAARKTEADVEEANLASRTKLWKIETGKVTVKVGDVRGLCWLYQIDQQTTDNLSLVATASNQRGYWEDFDEPHTPSWLYLQLESTADEIRAWESGVVHELLQTSAYFRELRRTVAPDEKDHALRERLKLHTERQELVFNRPQPPRLTVILNAGVLVCPVGDGDDVMVGQEKHLREMNRRDYIDVRVLPWEAGAHQAMRGGPFTILDFHHEDDPAVGYAPTLTGARYAEKADEVNELRRIFRGLYDRTVPIEMHNAAGA